MKIEAPAVLLSAIAVALIALVLRVDLPSRTGGHFFGDGATYHAMARSLAEDFDLRYEVKDLLREQREFEKGPGGLLLKRASGGLTFTPSPRRVRKEEGALYYAKPFLYPLLAAPFVRFLGTRGLLLTNALALVLALFLSYTELRRGNGAWDAFLGAIALILATVTPLYLVWLSPELLNLALATAALVAWRRDRALLSACLFGLATYSKPPQVLLALPLLIEPLLTRSTGLLRGLSESVRRGIVLVGATLALFAVNVAITGEWNYQGGERKSFEGCFPYASEEATFDRCGQWMTTEHLGPLVGREGQGDRSGEPLSKEEVRAAFRSNLLYFFIGRVGGAIPYDAPVFVALIAFLVFDRGLAGWLALATLILSAFAYILVIPANWYGGGAALGNRYFVSLLPLGLFFFPAGRARLAGGLGLLAGLALVGPLLLSPIDNSLDPGFHLTKEPFLSLPLELTELNDLSIFMDAWRKKKPYGDTEGDPFRHWPADPKAYYLYFPDNGTRGKEAYEEREGFWVRGGANAEVVLRSLEPVKAIHLRLTAGPQGDRVTVGGSKAERSLALRSGETVEIDLPADPGLPYYGTFVQSLRFRSRVVGDPLGSFVELSLDVKRRARSAPGAP